MTNDWYETMDLAKTPEIKVYFEDDNDDDCHRESTHTIINGKKILLAACCLPSSVDRETLTAARRIFGGGVRLLY